MTLVSEKISCGRRGRPKKEESFDKILKFRASKDHEYMRQALEEELEKSGSEILREALEWYYKFKIGHKL